MGKKKQEAASAPVEGAPGGMPPPSAPEQEAPAMPTGTPVEQVLTLQKQGMDNNQITQTLQQQGYTPQQVYDAMNQASVKGAVTQTPAEEIPPVEGMPPQPMPGAVPLPQGGMPLPPQAQPAGQDLGIEETVEAVVEEKWKDIEGTISKLNEWKGTADTRLTKFEQSMKDLKADMDNLHKAIVSKIGEYDQNILSVGTEIKAMEKVFSKVLPTFTENVNELARVAKGIKSKK